MMTLRITTLLALMLAGLASFSSVAAQTLFVGGKNFTEQVLVAEITSQLLRAKGYSVVTRTGFSTVGVRREQEAGLIDVYWEYTGTSLLTFNNIREALDPEEAYARVAALDAGKGLIWLTPSRINNSYALAMRRTEAAERDITSISDLADRVRGGETVRFLCNTEFFMRPDGLLPMQRAYHFAFGPADVVRVETDAIYDILRDDPSADVGLVFSTDGRVPAYDFVLLEDDRAFFPSYLLTPVVRKATLEQNPDLAAHLNALSAKLDNATIAGLNAMVDLHRRPVEEVAASFLDANDLL